MSVAIEKGSVTAFRIAAGFEDSSQRLSDLFFIAAKTGDVLPAQAFALTHSSIINISGQDPTL